MIHDDQMSARGIRFGTYGQEVSRDCVDPWTPDITKFPIYVLSLEELKTCPPSLDMFGKLRLARCQRTFKVQDKLRVMIMAAQEEDQERRRRRRFRTVIGFVGLVIAPLLCCLPLIIVALGTVGLLGLIMRLTTYRVPLTILLVGLLLIGIYQYRRTRK